MLLALCALACKGSATSSISKIRSPRKWTRKGGPRPLLYLSLFMLKRCSCSCSSSLEQSNFFVVRRVRVRVFFEFQWRLRRILSSQSATSGALFASSIRFLSCSPSLRLKLRLKWFRIRILLKFNSFDLVDCRESFLSKLSTWMFGTPLMDGEFENIIFKISLRLITSFFFF